jgi:hypothetical protein
MKITAIIKNRDENFNRAEIFGSNTHTEHKKSKFFCVNVGCVLLHLLHFFIQQRHFKNFFLSRVKFTVRAKRVTIPTIPYFSHKLFMQYALSHNKQAQFPCTAPTVCSF